MADWNGEEVFDALAGVKASGGSYAACRRWEFKLMNILGMTLQDYSLLDVTERTRRIIGEFLPDWLEALENDRIHREFLRKNPNGSRL